MSARKQGAVEKLAMDFRRWGRRRVKAVLSKTKRYGVLCSPTDFSSGRAG